MVDVIEVVTEFDPGFFLAGRVALLHLGPSGQAGAHQMTIRVARNVTGEGLDQPGLLRPGPDQAHVAAQYIHELRYFIQPGLAQPAAQAGDARVIGLRKGGGAALACMHGAKLPDAKRLPVAAGPPLAEEGGAGRVQPDRQPDTQAQRKPQRQKGQDQAHIKHPLEKIVGRLTVRLPQGLAQTALGRPTRKGFTEIRRGVQTDMPQFEQGQGVTGLSSQRIFTCVGQQDHAIESQAGRNVPRLAPVPGPEKPAQQAPLVGRTQRLELMLYPLRHNRLQYQQAQGPVTPEIALGQPEPQPGQQATQQHRAARIGLLQQGKAQGCEHKGQGDGHGQQAAALGRRQGSCAVDQPCRHRIGQHTGQYRATEIMGDPAGALHPDAQRIGQGHHAQPQQAPAQVTLLPAVMPGPQVSSARPRAGHGPACCRLQTGLLIDPQHVAGHARGLETGFIASTCSRTQTLTQGCVLQQA